MTFFLVDKNLSIGEPPNHQVSIVTFNSQPDEIKEIFLRTIPQLHEEIGWSAYNERVITQLRELPNEFILAIFKNQVIGYAQIRPRIRYLAYLAVKPEYQKQKIGTALMNASLETLIHHGCQAMILDFDSSNPSLVRFYTGFSDNYQLEHSRVAIGHYSDGAPCERMTIDLSSLFREFGTKKSA